MRQGDSKEGVVVHRSLVPMRGTLHHLVRYGPKQGGSPACKQQGYADPVSVTFTEMVQDKPKLFSHKREYSRQTGFIHHQDLLSPGNKSGMLHSRNRRAVKPSSNVDGSATGIEGIASTFVDVRDDMCVLLRDS